MRKPLVWAISMILVILLIFTGCSGKTSSPDEQAASGSEISSEQEVAEKTVVRAAALKGPTGMGMAKLILEDEAGNTANDYTFTLAGSPDLLLPQIVSGELDIAAVPTNAAAVLYNKTLGTAQVLAVNTLGVEYLLEKGDTVNTPADLAGRTVVMSGQATAAEYVFDHIISENEVEGVTKEFKSEHAEVASLALAGQADLVVLPEPFVTSLLSKDGGYRIALDLTEEWEKTGAGDLTMGAIVARSEFLEQNPEAAESFLKEYEESVNYANERPAEASVIIEAYDIMAAAVAEKAIPNCNIVCLTGEQMKVSLSSFLEVLFKADPQSIGGALPDDSFYYISAK